MPDLPRRSTGKEGTTSANNTTSATSTTSTTSTASTTSATSGASITSATGKEERFFFCFLLLFFSSYFVFVVIPPRVDMVCQFERTTETPNTCAKPPTANQRKPMQFQRSATQYLERWSQQSRENQCSFNALLHNIWNVGHGFRRIHPKCSV